ncbi:MAG: DUF211 domain-containing protein [Candidatus Asgardarchaeia archaeon]
MDKGIKLIVLDCLKPHKPILPDLALKIIELPGVNNVNITLVEVDTNTESIKISVEGNNLDYSLLRDTLKKYSTVVHSIDQVIAGVAETTEEEIEDYEDTE